MPTQGEKAWMRETGGDLTAEHVQCNLTHAALEDAISLTVNLLDALKHVEIESNQAINFDSFINNPFSQTSRGSLKSLHQYLLIVQQEYQNESEGPARIPHRVHRPEHRVRQGDLAPVSELIRAELSRMQAEIACGSRRAAAA